MELEKFITQTIVDITNGILEAQRNLEDTDVIINAYDQDKLRNINFDIATVTEKTKEIEGEVSAKIFVAGIDLEGKIGKSDSVTSRISFTVPVVLPNAHKVFKNYCVFLGMNSMKSSLARSFFWAFPTSLISSPSLTWMFLNIRQRQQSVSSSILKAAFSSPAINSLTWD